MKTTILKIVASCLLLLNGIGALFGGYKLMAAPDGHTMQINTGLLQHSPFHNYLIPGLVLFVANGLFSITVFGMVLLGYKKYPWFIIAQGCVLFGWIIIQVLLLQALSWLHLVWGSIGLLLALIGLLLARSKPHALLP